MALASHGALDAIGAQHIIDAQGKYVLPGGIDPHVHYDLSVSAAMTAQSPVAGSRAGLYGGTTTYIDFSMQAGAGSLVESIQDKMAQTAAQHPHADYALHAIMSGDWPLKNAGMIAEAISGGVMSFKFFTTFKGSLAIGGLVSDDGRIYSAMRETAQHGGITMVHCEDECLIDYHTRQLYAEGREQFWHIGEARPPPRRRSRGTPDALAGQAHGRTALHRARLRAGLGPRHYGSPRRWRRSLRRSAAPQPGDPELYKRPQGQRYMNYPPNKTQEHREVLWAACADRCIQTVASDDFTIPLAAKLSGATVDNVTGGTNSVETRMAVFWSAGVNGRHLSVPRFVDLTAAAPAKLFGLYGTKGVIRPGADADIVIMDGTQEHIYKQGENLHSDCDYSNWDAWQVTGFPVTTIPRGHVMVDQGAWVGPSGIGHFVPGRSPEQV